MNSIIRKFELNWERLQVRPLPEGAKVLCVREDDTFIYLYAEIDPNAKNEDRYFELFGIEEEMPCEAGIERTYIGSFFVDGDSVRSWHIYERMSNPLPWWAEGDAQVANQPYLIGYWARYHGEPFDENRNEEWQHGWKESDNDTRAEEEYQRQVLAQKIS